MSRRLKDLIASWSDQDADSRNAFLLIAGISAIIVLALIVVGFGYYSERIASKNDAVLKVGDHKITYAQLESRLKYELQGVRSLTSEQFPNVVTSIMVAMENEQLVRQIAAEKGITVTEADIEVRIREELGLNADATREAYASRLRRELLNSKLSLDEYKKMAESLTIEARLREFYAEPIPSEAEQIDPRILVVQSLTEATTIKTRLAAGETLPVLAAQLSLHPSKDSAGETGWIPRGALPEKVEEWAFAAELNTISDPIETDKSGVYIVQVRGREVRAVDDDARDMVVTNQLTQEVNDTKERLGSQFLLTAGQLSDLATSISNFLSAGG